MARRNNDVKFDWDNNTIIFNLRFSKESKIPGTPEFKRKKELKAEYPEFTFITKSARTKKKARPDKGLSFKHMEEYIGTFQNSEELLLVFEVVKIRARTTASSKKFVTDWFVAQFPNYRDSANIDNSNTIAFPVAIPDTANYKSKEA